MRELLNELCLDVAVEHSLGRLIWRCERRPAERCAPLNLVMSGEVGNAPPTAGNGQEIQMYKNSVFEMELMCFSLFILTKVIDAVQRTGSYG